MGTQAPDHAIQAAAPSRQSGWKDRKRHLWALGPALPVISTVALAAYALAPKKLRALAWTGPALFNAIIPALDQLIGQDTQNPPEDAIAELEKDRYYNRLVKSFIPAQYTVTLLGAWLATRDNVPLIDRIGIAMTVGTLNAFGINTAHELGHKQDSGNRNASLLALAPTFYTHFRIEHNYGHHKRVATPEDPASSRMGESFWNSCRARSWAASSPRSRLRNSAWSVRESASGAWRTNCCRAGRSAPGWSEPPRRSADRAPFPS